MCVCVCGGGYFCSLSSVIFTVFTVQLQVVMTAPEDQLFTLVSVCKLVSDKADHSCVI